jgi:hypothetical protein
MEPTKSNVNICLYQHTDSKHTDVCLYVLYDLLFADLLRSAAL